MAIDQQAPNDQLIRVVHLLRFCTSADAAPTLHRILLASDDTELTAASLDALRDPVGLAMARAFAEHSAWIVRARSAMALGRLGDAIDVPILQKLLKDPNWWVRYRAAQALVSHPFMTRTALESMQGSIGDRFAADVLGQALAEQPG